MLEWHVIIPVCKSVDRAVPLCVVEYIMYILLLLCLLKAKKEHREHVFLENREHLVF